jgi:hypothetical protein
MWENSPSKESYRLRKSCFGLLLLKYLRYNQCASIQMAQQLQVHQMIQIKLESSA